MLKDVECTFVYVVNTQVLWATFVLPDNDTKTDIGPAPQSKGLCILSMIFVLRCTFWINVQHIKTDTSAIGEKLQRISV